MSLLALLILHPSSPDALHQFKTKSVPTTLEKDSKTVSSKVKSLRLKPTQR